MRASCTVALRWLSCTAFFGYQRGREIACRASGGIRQLRMYVDRNRHDHDMTIINYHHFAFPGCWNRTIMSEVSLIKHQTHNCRDRHRQTCPLITGIHSHSISISINSIDHQKSFTATLDLEPWSLHVPIDIATTHIVISSVYST